MSEDNLQTFDQFLIEQKIISNPEKKPVTREKLEKTAANLAKKAAITALVLQHTMVAVKELDNQGKIEEWLRFQGLRAYTEIFNLPLSSKLVNHFLYGKGESLDITTDFLETMRTSVKNRDARMPIEGMTEDMSDSQILQKYIFNSFSEMYIGSEKANRITLVRTLERNEQGENVAAYHTADDLPNLVGRSGVRIFRVGRLRSDDTFYGLGDFTTSVEGKLTGIDDSGNAILENPTLSIFDRYDWQRGLYLGAQKTIGEMVEGSTLEDILPDQIKDVTLAVDDDDGATLVDAGIARPFDITANYRLDSSVAVPLENIALPKS